MSLNYEIILCIRNDKWGLETWTELVFHISSQTVTTGNNFADVDEGPARRIKFKEFFCLKCTRSSLSRLYPKTNPAVYFSRSHAFDVGVLKRVSMYPDAALD